MARLISDEIATRARSLDFMFGGMLLPNPDPVLRARGQHIRVYRDLRVDAHVGGCVRRRKSAVKALQWGLDRGQSPARVHKSIESLLADLPMDQIIGEALNAVLYGSQPMEIMWQSRGAMWVPDNVAGKPPEWFGFDTDNQLRFKTRDNQLQGELLPERKFLLPRQDATYDNPYGFADLSMCSFIKVAGGADIDAVIARLAAVPEVFYLNSTLGRFVLGMATYHLSDEHYRTFLATHCYGQPDIALIETCMVLKVHKMKLQWNLEGERRPGLRGKENS